MQASDRATIDRWIPSSAWRATLAGTLTRCRWVKELSTWLVSTTWCMVTTVLARRRSPPRAATSTGTAAGPPYRHTSCWTWTTGARASRAAAGAAAMDHVPRRTVLRTTTETCDRERVASGKGVARRVDVGGGRIL